MTDTHTHTHTHTEAETQAEGEAGSMQGARRGTRSQDPGITPWAKSRCSTTEPPRHPIEMIFESTVIKEKRREVNGK